MAILLTPIAFDIGSLRANDILVMFASLLFFVSKKSINRKILVLILICFAILLFSIFAGFVLKVGITLNRVVFFYKYFSIFLVILLCMDLFRNEIYLSKAIKVYFFVMLILSAWTFIYIILVIKGVIIGDIRPSFPFSRDYLASDAHLYSSTLAMMFSTYLLFIRKRLGHSIKFAMAITVFVLIAIILTGSRGGLLMSFMSLMIITFSFFLKTLVRGSLNYKALYLTFFVLLFLTLIPVIYSTFVDIDFSVFSKVANRATNFNLFEDESSNFRIIFLRQAISDMEKAFYIFGIGPLSSSKDFFDGIISILMSHGGLILLYFFFSLVGYVFFVVLKSRSLTSFDKLNLCFLIFLYFFSNVITEYIFVMRNMLLAIVGISIGYYISKGNKKIQLSDLPDS